MNLTEELLFLQKKRERFLFICNKLYGAGNKIILHTARGSGSGLDWSDKTRAQLARWGVRYHALTFGKPAADFYIDDKMLSVGQIKMFGNSR